MGWKQLRLPPVPAAYWTVKWPKRPWNLRLVWGGSMEEERIIWSVLKNKREAEFERLQPLLQGVNWYGPLTVNTVACGLVFWMLISSCGFLFHASQTYCKFAPHGFLGLGQFKVHRSGFCWCFWAHDEVPPEIRSPWWDTIIIIRRKL